MIKHGQSVFKSRNLVRIISAVLIPSFTLTLAFTPAHVSAVNFSERTNHERIPRQISLLEDEMCLGNYDVSEGSIIRTHDSQKLGGKYLNETDVGQGIKAREECFLLCCRTQHCNVAVFEEKNTGSCYLFDCGPTEDFRCKFTSQPQYTSAILRKPVLQLVNQHENELTQLRTPERVYPDSSPGISKANSHHVEAASSEKKPEVIVLPQTTVAPTVPHPSSSLISANASAVAPSEPQALTQRRSACSRNQFECKSSKECIAIYNACDGIPQCADGSDESSELNCPPDSSNPSLIPQKPDSVVSSKTSGPVGSVRGDSFGAAGYIANGNYDHSQSHYAPSPVQNPNQGMSQQEDMRLLSSQQMVPGRGNENLNGIAKGQMAVVPQYGVDPQQQAQSSLNIFAHKDGGIMDDTYNNPGQQRHASYWKQSLSDYNGADSAAGTNYNQDRTAYNNPGGISVDNAALQQPPYQYAPYPLQPGQSLQGRPYQNNNGLQSNVQIVPIAKQQSPYAPQPIPYGRNGGIQQSNGNPTGYNAWSPNQGVPVNQSPNRLIPVGDPRNNPATPPTVAPAQNQPATPSPTILTKVVAGEAVKPSEKSLQDLTQIQLPQTMSKLRSEIRDFAAESDNLMMSNTAGPGAVLAFAAGLIMSISMAVMVGCRLRRIGTRRRGKNRLDPDFLVDGMYL